MKVKWKTYDFSFDTEGIDLSLIVFGYFQDFFSSFFIAFCCDQPTSGFGYKHKTDGRGLRGLMSHQLLTLATYHQYKKRTANGVLDMRVRLNQLRSK